MYPLSEKDFQATAAASLRKIFINGDPFVAPFAPEVHAKTILFRYDYAMEEPLLHAIMTTAMAHHETGFFVSVLGHAQAEDLHRPYHWYIPFADGDQYEAFIGIGPTENVVYSPNGLWGILCSHESHGLLGGTTDFMQALYQALPSIEQQGTAFIKQWKYYGMDYGADISWLPALLRHVYGEEQAKQMLHGL